jgi:hypothetical protein
MKKRYLEIEAFEDHMQITLHGLDARELMVGALQILNVVHKDQLNAGFEENARLVKAVMEPLEALVQLAGAMYDIADAPSDPVDMN